MAMKIAIPLLVLLSLQQALSSRMLSLGGAQQAFAHVSDVCMESIASSAFQTASSMAEAAEFIGNQATYRKYEEYSISWTVRVTQGKDVADEIAERYGFTNIGQASFFFLYIICFHKSA